MTDSVFFPGAGSFGGEFRPLTQALGPASWMVGYPGRHGRGFGVPAASFDAVVGACADQIVQRAAGPPLLFGHSYGAYVACATAAHLGETGVEVASLVVVGAAAPDRLELPDRAASSPAEAAAYLTRIDPGMLAEAPSEEWRDLVAETTAQDLSLLGGFDPAEVAVLRCPVLAARGAEDPLTSDATIAEWQHVTTGPFAQRTFPGGHSDLLRSPDCAKWLRDSWQAVST
ncbi:alpha/beta fold hydrolase [Streptomyces sp. SDr-06]|uniref:thioesterase II family protein n=1 Tax=Streptomyces sp. SDr-06 TaxID=2267702 RepID=UPI000DE9C31A|nr:alpha/beta fold hydrolase [Streptomyces sp. SDr-06]RCH67763.1 alpha/beta fold hydrolase [Streptomyces sp. SDr-06]